MAPPEEKPYRLGFSDSESQACCRLIEIGLAEDLDAGGDITTIALVEESAHGEAAIVSRDHGVLAGLPAAQAVFSTVDSSIIVQPRKADGEILRAGDVVAVVCGPVRSLLSSERLALNFLTHLSGVATLTSRFVAAVANTRCQVYDTRKTHPGWRLLEKYAVRQGGGHNHRVGLYDAVLIKDNHLAQWSSAHRTARARSVADAVRHARAAFPAARFVEVEVDTLDQLRDALAGNPDLVLLDNMQPDVLRQAVDLRDQRATGVILEASGGISLKNAAAIAATGVDRISIGALTQSPPALDIGMDWKAS
jgi:nicotinate-nucleotide pyrophosphorylase (carboxylating)